MTHNVEKMAEKLAIAMWPGIQWDEFPVNETEQFLRGATHVLRLIKEAEIEALTWSLDPNENQTNMNDPYWLIEQRIAALRAEQEKLNNE